MPTEPQTLDQPPVLQQVVKPTPPQQFGQPAPVPQTITPPPTTDNVAVSNEQDTYQALNKLFDETEPTKPTDTPATQATEPAPTPVGTDDFEKQLNEFQPSPDDHPNKVKGIEELRRLSREEHARAVELEAKIKEEQARYQEAEAKWKASQLSDTEKKEFEELKEFRKSMDLRLDPEFNKTYVQPVQEAEADIMRLLTQAGVKEDIAKFIQDNGGIIKMSQSSELLEDNTTLSDWVSKELLERTPSLYKNRIMGRLTSALDLLEKGQKEMSDFQGNAKERFEARQQKLQAEFNSGRDEAIAKLGDLVKPKTPTATATAEERLQIEAHNNRLKQAEQVFADYFQKSADPRVGGEILVKASQADVLLGLYNDAQANVKALQAQLDQIKGSGSHSKAGQHTQPSAPTPTTPFDLLKKSTPSALSELLDQAGVTR